ncbi:hypothetical protein DMN91_000633 [Ooceraea biroi]|uniref:Uncharacterized protein n=1 Tax=Ooceraea biroi TaxID=2015173 RepID=A0A3L8E2H1_OOCBI|nr:uncharacterized protein LOC113562266 [Ooceraea biroi]RLU26836.1 hypothetical protein DMN91_000633 [Ooceraea biroi]
MSLCPSSSHQLVAAAIAFRRARRKFPKNFGLDSALERAKGNPRESPAETTTTREGPINQARSSASLVRRAYSSRSDHICPASVRCRDHDRSCSEEGSIGCSCCRTRNVAEDISELRNDCSGGDTVDVAPGRECDQSVIASSADRKNEFAKPAERDRCETSYGISGGKAQHKSWREQMRGEDGRLYARQCSSKNYPGIISVACEENDELVRDESDNDDDNEEENVGNDDGDDNEEDDDDVAVINHKDSMCILAEKYKTSRKSRAKRCAKDNCKDKSQNKSQTSEAIDQPRESPRGNANAVPHEESASVKHVCRVRHCEGCDTARACRDRGCRQAPPEGEYDQFKCPLNGTRCCSSRAPCGRTF